MREGIDEEPGPGITDIAGFGAWLARGRRWIGWRDLVHVLSPLSPLVTTADFIVRHDRARLDDDLGARDPALVAWLAEGASLLARVFRLDVHGLEHLPTTGPALLVGNHNGGLVPMDGLFTMAAVHDRFGPGRALYPLGHDLIHYDRVAHRFAQAAGILRAGHEGAARALRAGHLVLVYPGSDIETFRSWRERGRIELAGRTGFLSLALRENVPIIPVVSAGTHEQWVVLTRGDHVARALHTGRLLRTKVLPLALSLPWGLSFGLLPYLPLPAQTTLAFGAPMTFDFKPDRASDPETLARAYDQVSARMQTMLDALYAGRVPFIGQPQAQRDRIDASLSGAAS